MGMQNKFRNCQEPEKFYENDCCVLCLAGPDELEDPMAIVMPCAHKCLCQECAENYDHPKCPVCRTRTNSYLPDISKADFQLIEKGEKMMQRDLRSVETKQFKIGSYSDDDDYDSEWD